MLSANCLRDVEDPTKCNQLLTQLYIKLLYRVQPDVEPSILHRLNQYPQLLAPLVAPLLPQQLATLFTTTHPYDLPPHLHIQALLELLNSEMLELDVLNQLMNEAVAGIEAEEAEAALRADERQKLDEKIERLREQIDVLRTVKASGDDKENAQVTKQIGKGGPSKPAAGTGTLRTLTKQLDAVEAELKELKEADEAGLLKSTAFEKVLDREGPKHLAVLLERVADTRGQPLEQPKPIDMKQYKLQTIKATEAELNRALPSLRLKNAHKADLLTVLEVISAFIEEQSDEEVPLSFKLQVTKSLEHLKVSSPIGNCD